MTVNELIKKLQDVPLQLRDAEVQIYIRGPVSGMVDIESVTVLDGTAFIESFDAREVRR